MNDNQLKPCPFCGAAMVELERGNYAEHPWSDADDFCHMRGFAVHNSRYGWWNRRAPVSNWQPIETAPRDGSDVLLYKPSAKRPIKVDRWVQRETTGNWWECRPAEMPTHWMPLPNPPEGNR